METNESILGRAVVAIGDRKQVGKVEDVCIDIDTRAVAGFMVQSVSTGSSLVLPFDQTLATGDTFITIEARDVLLALEAEEAKPALAEGFKLLGVDAFSRLGNALGPVAGYSYDTTYGTITEVTLEDGSTYAHDTFVFFAPDMIFIDDGGITAADERSGKKSKKPVAKKGAKRGSKAGARKPAKKSRTTKSTSRSSTRPAKTEAVKPIAVAKPEPKPEPTPAPTDKDAEMKDYLRGMTISEEVTSEDGAFKVAAGTVLSKELVDKAAEHGALLLLTLSVED